MNKRIEQLSNKLEQSIKTLQSFPVNLKKIWRISKKEGLFGILKAVWADLFLGRTVGQWAYFISLSSIPLLLAVFYPDTPASLFASWTGVVCVILVAEGRATNYLFGLLSNIVYFALSYDNMFYGEVMTAIFFIVMQPIGLYFWLVSRINGEKVLQENTRFESRKLTVAGWLKWLLFTAVVWLSFGLIYISIGARRPFRDSVTDGTNWTGQFLQSYLYREQWLFWIATNLFSIYLWWGESVQIQGMYWVYTINSIVGWYQWSRSMRSEVA